jgi:hypothetical protein
MIAQRTGGTPAVCETAAMAGDDWAPIEPSRPGFRAGRPDGDGHGWAASSGPRHMAGAGRASRADAPARRSDASTRRVSTGAGPLARVGLPLVALAAVVGLVVAAGTGGVSLARRADPPQALTDSLRDGAGDDGLPGGAAATAAGSDEVTPHRAVARAAYRLDEAGTFAYQGTVDIGGPSLARPGFSLGGLTAVTGEVELPARTHEIATAMDGSATETAVRNISIWARIAIDGDDLERQPLEIVGELSGGVAVPSGVALLPEWLMATTDRRAEAPDGQGRRRYRARLGGWAGVEIGDRPPPEAEVVVTVDEDGDPAHVTITAVTDDRRMSLDIEIERLGEPVGAWALGGPTSATGGARPEEVVDAGIPDAVELGDVPDGWILYDIELRADSPTPGCSTLSLSYQDADEVETGRQYLSLDVTSADCSFGAEWGEPLTIGGLSGTGVTRSDGVVAYLSDGSTNLEVWTDLRMEELEPLLATLEPFDPETRPED